MSEMVNQLYSFDEDGIQRLTKDLNYMFQHLDEKNVRRLYTEYCEISSKDGETEIDGPLLVMRASGSAVVRLKAGWDAAAGEFVFNLYDKTGNPVIELDSTGDAVFRGSINTDEDIYVGNRIFVGWNESTNIPPAATLSTRGIYFIEPGTTKYMAAIYSTNVQSLIGTTYPVYEFEMETSNAMNITSKNKSRYYMYAGYDGASTATINSTDKMSFRAFNGLAFFNTEHNEHSTAKRGTYIGEDNHAVYLGSYDDYYNQVTKVIDQEQKYMDNELRYYFSHNQRFIASPTSDWLRNATTNVTHNYSTKTITSTNNIYFRLSDTTINTYASMESTIPNRDLTTFPDGSSASTDDFIVFIFYAYSTNINPTHGVYIHLGTNNANYYRYYLTSTNGDEWTTGWNHLWRKIGAYESAAGAPTLNNISWARVGIRGQGDTTASIVMDYMGIARANSTDATAYNTFQRYTSNGVTENQKVSYFGEVFREHEGEPTLCPVNINGYAITDTPIRGAVQDFDVEVQGYSLRSNYAPTLTAYFDADNYSIAEMTSGRLRVRGYQSGSTFGDYIDCKSYSAYEDIHLKFKRQANKWTAAFWTDGDAESYREVTYFNGPTTRLDYVYLYLGHSDLDSGVRIKDIKLKRYNSY
jgi:hypothetical protein